ncbi:hypothetical protein [Flavobacterium psychrotrophum]|uniref:hypothetical protein n=1 Tax=Flavobacterium psychrotrophum TaxID=2294119 RepID=UPI000E31767A|nr:hypothetical protein [Flavobacterium psychrotrophum]
MAKAGTIDELNSLFILVPPPVPASTVSKPPLPPEPAYTKQSYIAPVEHNNSSGTRRIITIVAVAIALFIGITAFSAYQNNQQEKHNLELRIAEQERQVREARIREIKTELKISYRNLENAKINLHDVSAFKLLRSSSERHEQISEAEAILASWQKSVNELESELNSLNIR